MKNYFVCPICGKYHLGGIRINWSLRYSMWKFERDMKKHPERITTIKTEEELHKFFEELSK